MTTVINHIRKANPGKTLYFNTGDTLQGSAEAMFTRGQALIEVMNLLKPDFDEPGNWDYLYGSERFLETFVGSTVKPPLFDTKTVAANLYYVCADISEPLCPGQVSAKPDESDRPALGVDKKDDRRAGLYRLSIDRCHFPLSQAGSQRPLPPYLVKTINGLKVGVLGMTTARAIRAVGPVVTKGFVYTDGENEMPYYINQLRNILYVDIIVMISELELARTIDLASRYPGVDFILNADMHERTIKPIVLKTGTVLVEEGQDGTMLGEIHLKVKKGHKLPGDGKLTWK